MDKKIPRKNNNYIKTRTVYQSEATECGAAALCMILQYFGCYIPIEQLRIDCGVSRQGSNVFNIMKAAQKYGLKVRTFSRPISQLIAKCEVPAIIFWNNCHFVVFEGCKNGKAYVNDPAGGKKVYTYEELEAGYSNVVMLFETTEEFRKTKKQSPFLELITTRMNASKRDILGLLCAGMVLVFPGLVIPVFSQIFIDDILGQDKTYWIGTLLAAMLFIILYQIFFTWLKSRVLIKLQIKLKLISGYKLLQHMFRLPVNFFEQRYAGDLSNSVDNNNRVNNFVAGDLADTALDIIVSLAYLIILIFYNPILAGIGVMGVAINMAVALFMAKSLGNLATKNMQDYGKLVGVMYSGISVVDTLKASGAENAFTSRILGLYAKYSNSEQNISRKAQILGSVPGAITEAFDIIILIVGGLLIINGNITAGVLVGFTQLLSSFTGPVNEIVGFFQKINSMRADVGKVNDIARYKEAEQFREGQTFNEDMFFIRGDVELKNVSFGYTSLAPPILKNINFRVESGRTIALVGASGSGKTTIGKLISGLYDPWEGEILIDGVPLRKLPPALFNSNVTTVSQNISIFGCSVSENLTLWDDNIDEKDIVSACRDACIHETIVGHEEAYDYLMDEGGSNFSGGQRQRLEIARALVANPAVIVLDEATSALDAKTEVEVIKNIRKRGCTCIVVAHRLSTIRDCDEILVIDKGEIVQRGTHEEMKNVDGPYRELIKAV